MNYIIAGHAVEIETQLIAGLSLGAALAPFAVPAAAAADPVLRLRYDPSLRLDAFDYRELDAFDFADADADCHFGSCGSDYIFYMQSRRNGAVSLFVKSGDSAEVLTDLLPAAGDDIGASMMRFGIWMMYGLAVNPLHTVAIHSSVICCEGGAVLFLGESGTGKSTHTRLWREHITGARLLNDDSPIIRMTDGVPTAYGSPWSGKTPCYRNEHYPIRGIVRLSQAPHNRIVRLPLLQAIGALLPSCPPAFAYDTRLQDCICDTLSAMLATVPVYHLECLPDADAARLSYSTLFGL